MRSVCSKCASTCEPVPAWKKEERSCSLNGALTALIQLPWWYPLPGASVTFTLSLYFRRAHLHSLPTCLDTHSWLFAPFPPVAPTTVIKAQCPRAACAGVGSSARAALGESRFSQVSKNPIPPPTHLVLTNESENENNGERSAGPASSSGLRWSC